jgi:hypothetical protein
MDLGEDDEAWAAAVVRLVRGGERSEVEAAVCLENSPFNLDRSREAYYEIWSSPRASV